MRTFETDNNIFLRGHIPTLASSFIRSRCSFPLFLDFSPPSSFLLGQSKQRKARWSIFHYSEKTQENVMPQLCDTESAASRISSGLSCFFWVVQPIYLAHFDDDLLTTTWNRIHCTLSFFLSLPLKSSIQYTLVSLIWDEKNERISSVPFIFSKEERAPSPEHRPVNRSV